MGLGIYVEGEVGGRGSSRKKLGGDRLFSEVVKAVHSAIDDPLMRRLIHTSVHSNTLSATLHPAAEPVAFLWQPQQVVRVSAKTSTVGPGYHAFLVDLLTRIGEAMGLEWVWSTEDADDTGFAVTTDFARLQSQMASLLRQLAEKMVDVEARGGTGLMLNMRADYPRPVSHGVVWTPLGVFSKAWLQALTTAVGNQLSKMGRQFYPWWEREADALFWKNTGTALMWCDVPWHVPYDDHEKETCQLALDCLGRATELDGSMPVPVAEASEL